MPWTVLSSGLFVAIAKHCPKFSSWLNPNNNVRSNTQLSLKEWEPYQQSISRLVAALGKGRITGSYCTAQTVSNVFNVDISQKELDNNGFQSNVSRTRVAIRVQAFDTVTDQLVGPILTLIAPTAIDLASYIVAVDLQGQALAAYLKTCYARLWVTGSPVLAGTAVRYTGSVAGVGLPVVEPCNGATAANNYAGFAVGDINPGTSGAVCLAIPASAGFFVPTGTLPGADGAEQYFIGPAGALANAPDTGNQRAGQVARNGGALNDALWLSSPQNWVS